MAKNATQKERQHMSRVAELGCCRCGRPAQVHHILGSKYSGTAQRASHFHTIPLCPDHHTDGDIGVAVHKGVKTWEEEHGTEEHHLKRTLDALGIKYEQSSLHSKIIVLD